MLGTQASAFAATRLNGVKMKHTVIVNIIADQLL